MGSLSESETDSFFYTDTDTDSWGAEVDEEVDEEVDSAREDGYSEQLAELINQLRIDIRRTNELARQMGTEDRPRFSSFSIRDLVPVLKNSGKYKLECGICFEEKPVLCNLKHKPATISEINTTTIQKEIVRQNYFGRSSIGFVPDNCVFYSPCGKHPVCKECLVKTITNVENPPINRTHSLVPCLSLEDCRTSAGMKVYYQTSHVKKVLNREQFEYYKELENRFRFPGFEVVKCPMARRYSFLQRLCGAENIIPIETIQNTLRGELIVCCTQNIQCCKRFCYHCRQNVYESEHCPRCYNSMENTNPMSLNFYFYRPETERQSAGDIFFRNHELTVDIVVAQLLEIANSERTIVKCFNCLVSLFKTEQCNGMAHCGMEVCYACGKASLKNATLTEHWSSSGMNGCPRWDSDTYWNGVAQCGFQCVQDLLEDGCYGDENGGICEEAAHQAGIVNLNNERKRCMIYKKLNSLPVELRRQVFSRGCLDYQLKHWLPKQETMEYIEENNTYDVLKRYSERLLTE